MNKRYLFILLLVSIMALAAVSTSYTEEDPTSENKIPEWLKRVHYGVDLGTGQKPRIYFETIQPLYQDQDKQNTYFIQPRYSLESKESAFNIGIGYRRLLNDNTILLGANSFFDYEADDDHYRVGAGVEAFINQAELRGNAYIGLSPRRLVEEVGSTRTYEKAVDGFDAEGGLPLPYMNWIKVYGGGFWYDYEQFSDKKGWKIRNQFEPFEFSTINLTVWDDNKGDPEIRVDARVAIPFEVFYDKGKPKRWCKIGLSKEAYPEKLDHSKKTLDRVEREYKIELERWTETTTSSGNTVIEIRRGDT